MGPLHPTSCSTGTHVWTEYGVGHGFSWTHLQFTGTVTSLLIWEGGAHDHTCFIWVTPVASCAEHGEWPPGNEPFEHVCESYLLAVGFVKCHVSIS